MTGTSPRDLAQYLSTSLQKEFFKDHLKELKQFYFESLKKHCPQGSSLENYTIANYLWNFKKKYKKK